MAAADVFDHGRADLASECTLLFEVDVLRANVNFRTFAGPGHGIEIDVRGTDQHVDVVGNGSSGNALGQLNRFVSAQIHFPVTSNQWASHDILQREFVFCLVLFSDRYYRRLGSVSVCRVLAFELLRALLRRC